MINDLRKDWHRWTTGERLLATAFLAILLTAAPAAILMAT
jgi:hypothetical protein